MRGARLGVGSLAVRNVCSLSLTRVTCDRLQKETVSTDVQYMKRDLMPTFGILHGDPRAIDLVAI